MTRVNGVVQKLFLCCLFPVVNEESKINVLLKFIKDTPLRSSLKCHYAQFSLQKMGCNSYIFEIVTYND